MDSIPQNRRNINSKALGERWAGNHLGELTKINIVLHRFSLIFQEAHISYSLKRYLVFVVLCLPIKIKAEEKGRADFLTDLQEIIRIFLSQPHL